MSENGKAHVFYIGKVEYYRNPNGRGNISIPDGDKCRIVQCRRMNSLSDSSYSEFVAVLRHHEKDKSLSNIEKIAKKRSIIREYLRDKDPYCEIGGNIVVQDYNGNIGKMNGRVSEVKSLEDSISDILVVEKDKDIEKE